MKPTGLKQRIQRASTVQEVNDLLVIGSAFQQVADGTRRKWEKTAKRKLAELKGQP